MVSADDKTSWREAERRRAGPARELARILDRGRRRARVALAIAVLAAAGIGLFYYLRASQHEAEIVLRVSEGAVSTESGIARAEARGYVESALLTRPLLSEIVQEEDLFPARRERGEEAAVSALREAIEIEVFGNYFAAWDSVGARSLRIRLRYASQDRAEAMAVVRGLARTIRRAEREQRHRRLEEGSALSQAVLARAEDQIGARERQVADRAAAHWRERPADPARARALRFRAERTAELLESERERVREAREARGELEIRRAAVRERLGLLFTVVDERMPPPRRGAGARAAGLAGLGFALALPLAVAAAGAFDRRVYSREDVARLGVPAIGRVPRFRGHRLGAPAPPRR